jgi:antibiotic biosynthesis monooxygenase (ABM) superfamily enzyme
MKTTKQWLKTLPSPLRESALKQCTASVKSERLSEAIRGFSVWIDTEEGIDFWASFTLALKWAEKLDNK